MGSEMCIRDRSTHIATGLPVLGYEIHIGRTDGPDCNRPVTRVGDRDEGAQSADGRIQGLYLHGMFTEDAFRTAWLAGLGADSAEYAYDAAVEQTLDALADHLEEYADLDALLDIARHR